MDIKNRILVVVLLAVIGIPAVGAITWNIDEVHVLPENSSDDAEGVVLAHVLNEDGDPVNPADCSTMNVLYKYPNTILNEEMVYARGNGEPGWFYNDTFVANSSEYAVDVFAGGECNGIETDSSTQQRKYFAPDGEILIEFLNDTDRDFWEEEYVEIQWNATKGVLRGEEFVPGANPQYRLYNTSMDVVREGEFDPYYSAGVERHDDRFSAQFQMPRGGGLHVLSVTAHNASLEMENPYGGAARVIWVRPTFLEGKSYLDYPEEQCEMTAEGYPTCEKGAAFEIGFTETYAEADNITATVKSEGFGGGEVEQFELSRWNDTYWNESFTVAEDFDTAAFGRALEVEVHAKNQFEEMDHKYSEVVETQRFNVSRFDVVESTQPFVHIGEVIPISVGAVHQYTRDPVLSTVIDQVELSVDNPQGQEIHRVALGNESFDMDTRLFVEEFEVPFNTSVGMHTVDATVTDIFGVEQSKTFEFSVLGQQEGEDPVVVVATGGQVGSTSLNKTYSSAGARTEDVLLRNLGETTAIVDVFLDGDMAEVATPAQNRPLSLSPDQQNVSEIEITLEESGTYTGDIILQVSTSDTEDYNITVPATLTLECQYTVGELCITRTSLQKDIQTTGEQDLSFRVQNPGEYREYFTVEPQGNITQFVFQQSVSVNAGNTSTISLPFQVETYDSGFYNGSVVILAGEALSLNSSINVDIQKGSLSIDSPDQDLGTFVEGDSASFTLLMNNTGTQHIEEVYITADGLGVQNMQETVDLEPQEGTSTTVSGTVSEGEAINVSVNTGAGANASMTLDMKTYRDYGPEISQMEQQIRDFRDRLTNKTGEEKSDVSNRLLSMESQLNQSKRYWEEGAYAQAERKFLQAEGLEGSVSQDISSLPDQQQSSGVDLPLLPMAIILVIVFAIGIILYLSVVPERPPEP